MKKLSTFTFGLHRVAQAVRVTAACAFVLTASLTGSAAVAQDAAPARLRLDWTTLGYHAPFYYGVALGVYDRAGIKLDIQEGKGSGAVAQLAASGNDEFGLSDATTVAQLVSKGLPGKVVMGILRGTTLALFYAPGRGISKPADLQGHKIAVCPGDGISNYIAPYLQSLGVNGSQVQQFTVDCNLKYAIVAQGQADAVMSYGTAGGPLLRKVGIPDAPSFPAGPDFYLPGHGIVVSDKLVKERPDLIRKFVAATAESWAAAKKDPDAAVAAVVQAKPLLKGEEAALKATLLNSFSYLDAPSSAGKPFGWQDPQDWEKALAILRQYAGLPTSATPATVMTNEFIAGK